MYKLFVAALLSAIMASTANAIVVKGTFFGVVYHAEGTVNGLDLGTLTGLPLFGTFTYDSDALSLAGVCGGSCKDFEQSQSEPPMILSVTAGCHSFTVTGTGFSSVLVDTSADGTFLEARTQNVVGGPSPATIARGDIPGEIAFQLTGHLGAPYLTDTNNVGTLAFDFLPSGGIFPGNGAVTLVDAGHGQGSILFYVAHAAAHPLANTNMHGNDQSERAGDDRPCKR